MEEREKIKQIYRKLDIEVGEDIIESVLYDKEKCKDMMKLYKREELESMNYILGKQDDNKYFTAFELEALSQIDLFDRKVIEICRIIWMNRNNEEKLKSFLTQLNKEGVN